MKLRGFTVAYLPFCLTTLGERMNLSVLKNVLLDEPKYRLEQVKKAVFADFIESWAEAMTLSTELRNRLEKQCPLCIEAKIYPSKDGQTVKAAIALKGGLKIESVLMRYEAAPLRPALRRRLRQGEQACSERGRTARGRNTICLSSQVGCALGCNFCATGKEGFKRNLTADEIIDQVLFWGRYLNKSGEKVTNIVFMGMGEPFLNYDNVLESARVLNDKDGFNLGARHFSISTIGVIDGIKKLSEEPLQINLAISLHAPTDELRSKLMPIGKEYTIRRILSAVDKYIEKTSRKVMFEYIMIDGVNDGEKQARQLAGIMNPSASCHGQTNPSASCHGQTNPSASCHGQTKKKLYFVNLIPCNPVGDFDAAAINCRFKPSPQERIEKFKKILKDAGVQVNQRYSFGQDINAACGQLAGSVK